MAEKEKAFSFNRETDNIVATRDFDHGVISAQKGETISAAQMRDLSDDAVRHLVKVARVAEVKSGKTADADKGAAKP